jgi:uncharacterized membrane protein
MKEIVLAIISGFCFGVTALLTKIALLPLQVFEITSFQHWKIFLFSLPFLGIVVFGFLSVIFFWWGLRHGKAMIVAPLCSSFTILTSIIGAVVLFNEVISVAKALGIIAIAIGTMILRK